MLMSKRSESHGGNSVKPGKLAGKNEKNGFVLGEKAFSITEGNEVGISLVWLSEQAARRPELGRSVVRIPRNFNRRAAQRKRDGTVLS